MCFNYKSSSGITSTLQIGYDYDLNIVKTTQTVKNENNLEIQHCTILKILP